MCVCCTCILSVLCTRVISCSAYVSPTQNKEETCIYSGSVFGIFFYHLKRRKAKGKKPIRRRGEIAAFNYTSFANVYVRTENFTRWKRWCKKVLKECKSLRFFFLSFFANDDKHHAFGERVIAWKLSYRYGKFVYVWCSCVGRARVIALPKSFAVYGPFFWVSKTKLNDHGLLGLSVVWLTFGAHGKDNSRNRVANYPKISKTEEVGRRKCWKNFAGVAGFPPAVDWSQTSVFSNTIESAYCNSNLFLRDVNRFKNLEW